ncbi:hypothetical protein BDV96DRAFT_205682 [Lophiotrema nucula]|uniref:Uncharacterized protein n=1 Tax=Lophiotrema nucula TaxID=690887 RepID=A0A6A5ZPV1_9PLEO|nr:hypothetical protein BDV96DRAFT_205682 [Lophiotrema nucula]
MTGLAPKLAQRRAAASEACFNRPQMADRHPMEHLRLTSHIPLEADAALLAIVQSQNPPHRKLHTPHFSNIDDTVPIPNIPFPIESDQDQPCKVCSRVNLEEAFQDGSTWTRRRWSFPNAGADSPCHLCRVVCWMLPGSPGHERVREGLRIRPFACYQR